MTGPLTPLPLPEALPEALDGGPLPAGGCHVLELDAGPHSYRGTLRVDRGGPAPVVSGDLYRFPLGSAPAAGTGIPVFARARYHSYLRGTAVAGSTVVLEQYDYRPPPPGSFTGRFPVAPGSRTVSLTFTDGGATWDGAPIVVRRVSSFLRRCSIEIDTVAGAVPPQAVPGPGGVVEDLETVLASAGWEATVVDDRRDIAVPDCVAAATDCWDDACLHALMQAVRRPDTDLDRDWHLHLLVVPGHITCSRGKMYDTIVVPREAVVSYSDDGYPAEHSDWFGPAEGRTQREVPRAYLRSAAHEVVHGFNQVHQETEGGADNSIMTTTPSVADVLHGTFPGGIRLAVNARVRRHLAHFPDPVVRPGGHGFSTWTTAPLQADAGPFVLDIRTARETIELGEPLPLSWTLTHTADTAVVAPSEVSIESLYARIAVTGPDGRREIAAFVVECEQTRLVPLPPGTALDASTTVFWCSDGFAFTSPGPHRVEVRVEWTDPDGPVSVRASVPVTVAAPRDAIEDARARTLLDPEVGMWVALGGAPHLTRAETRLREAERLRGPLRGYPG